MMATISPMTEEEIRKREEKFKLYDYYGIPYGIFDDSDENEIPFKIRKDWSNARAIIAMGKEVPKDLEKRLLEYKRKSKNNTMEGNSLSGGRHLNQ